MRVDHVTGRVYTAAECQTAAGLATSNILLTCISRHTSTETFIIFLQVGDDVEFTLVRDSQAAAKDGGAKKLAAVRCGAAACAACTETVPVISASALCARQRARWQEVGQALHLASHVTNMLALQKLQPHFLPNLVDC